MRKLLFLVLFLFTLSFLRGQSISLTPSKFLTLYPRTQSVLLTTQGSETSIKLTTDLKLFVDTNREDSNTVDKKYFKYIPYKPNNKELVIGEIGAFFTSWFPLY